MKLDLTELLQETGRELSFEDNIDVSFEEDIKSEGPVRLELDLLNAGEMVTATGRLEATMRLVCSRCLKEYSTKFRIGISEQFSKKQAGLHGKDREIELGDEDFVVPIEEDNSLDLSELVRQYIVSEIPIKALCTESCKSPVDNVREKRIDPRLLKLKEALKDAGTKKATQ